MPKFVKRVAAMGVSIALLAAAILPLSKINAFATSRGEGDYKLTLSVDSNADWLAALTINATDWNPDDEYLTGNGQYYLTAELHVPNDQVRDVTSIRPGGGSGPFAIQQAGVPEAWDETHTKFTYTMNYDLPDGVMINHLSLNPYSENNGGQPEPEGNTVAQVHISSVEGEYTDTCLDRETQAEVDCDIPYVGQMQEMSFSINGGRMEEMPWGQDPADGYDIEYHYDSDEQDQSVILTLGTRWHMMFETEVIINNQPYEIPIDYADQSNWLHHYAGQIVSFDLEVPKSDNYDIVVKIRRNPVMHIGNFLWTADPDHEWEIEKDPYGGDAVDEDGHYIYVEDEDGNRIPNHAYIGHSTLALVTVAYELDGVSYSCNSDEETCTIIDGENEEVCSLAEDEHCGIPYVEFSSEGEGYDDGSLVVPAGARVTMRVIPDYGYQVMDINVAELTTTDEGIGEFSFTIPAGAAYFTANVVKIDDTVNSESDKVTGGVIDLGDEQSTLAYGTARLDVKDVDLSEEDIAGFENAAEGYNVKNYLDISLFNVIYKGDADDAWENQVRDLNEPATITLQLEEGVDGNEVVIVHQKHDGTYEVIPTIYDPVANTLTFTTTSFSNYAIASRTTSAPNTGGLMGILDGAESSAAIALTSVLIAVALSIGYVAIKRSKAED